MDHYDRYAGGLLFLCAQALYTGYVRGGPDFINSLRAQIPACADKSRLKLIALNKKR